MRKSLPSLLDNLIEVLKPYNSSVDRHLQAGLTEKQILEKIEGQGLVFPAELIELYKWRNGFSKESQDKGKFELFPCGCFLDLDSAIVIYKRDLLKDDSDKSQMFPLFGTLGEYYFIDLNNSSDTYKMIFYYAPTEEEYEMLSTYFDSIESCFETIIAWYKKNVFIFKNLLDREVWNFEYNSEEYGAVGKQYNPHSSFWQ